MTDGKRFGLLTIIETRGRKAICRCDCGKQCLQPLYALEMGHTISCGCYKKSNTAQRMTKHGGSRLSEYSSYRAARRRCTDPKDPSWHRYGGRGISMCERWIDSFEVFLADMGPKPSPNHTIERIDYNAPYEPNNCRWANRREQANNMRSNVHVTFRGEKMTVRKLAGLCSIPYITLRYRLLTSNWLVDDAITIPVGSHAAIVYGRARRQT